MNLKIASAKCMRNLSERNKPVVLQSELDKIQELINIAAAEGKRKIFVEETNLDCCNLAYLPIENYTVTKGVHCTYDEDDYSEIQIDGYWIEW